MAFVRPGVLAGPTPEHQIMSLSTGPPNTWKVEHHDFVIFAFSSTVSETTMDLESASAANVKAGRITI